MMLRFQHRTLRTLGRSPLVANLPGLERADEDEVVLAALASATGVAEILVIPEVLGVWGVSPSISTPTPSVERPPFPPCQCL